MDAGVVSGLLQIATQEAISRRDVVWLEGRREQKASHRERLRRRGAVCFVGAPLRCTPASPSSRLLASDPAALATPHHTLFQQPASHAGPRGLSRRGGAFLRFGREGTLAGVPFAGACDARAAPGLLAGGRGVSRCAGTGSR